MTARELIDAIIELLRRDPTPPEDFIKGNEPGEEQYVLSAEEKVEQINVHAHQIFLVCIGLKPAILNDTVYGFKHVIGKLQSLVVDNGYPHVRFNVYVGPTGYGMALVYNSKIADMRIVAKKCKRSCL